MAATAEHHDKMRQPAEWMRPMDDRILEVLSEVGQLTPIALSKEGLVPRVNTTAAYTSRRCNHLADYGMVRFIDSGLFAITTDGRDYLAGDLDASTLEELDEPLVADE